MSHTVADLLSSPAETTEVSPLCRSHASGGAGLRVVEHTSLRTLAPLVDRWNQLARQVPFRSWEWQSTWWRHYGELSPGYGKRLRLCCLEVRSAEGVTLGIAPWYGAWSPVRGWVLRFLGTGEVCSDYLSVLCQPQQEQAVTAALAGWLVERSGAGRHTGARRQQRGAAARKMCGTVCPPSIPTWDLLELDGFDQADQTMAHLANALRCRGVGVHWEPGPCCWRIDLPESWEKYLATQMSRNQRKQLRRLERAWVHSGRVKFHHLEHEHELPDVIRMLVDLHQWRHRALGRPGCFASPRFAAFHLEAIPLLFRAGRLLVTWISLDGQPAAIDYAMLGDDAIYFYQAGLDPAKAEASPGRVMTMLTLQHVIECGYRAFDFLRGDEAYKAHWRAKPRPSAVLRAVAPRIGSRLRHALWALARGGKRSTKRILHLLRRQPK